MLHQAMLSQVVLSSSRLVVRSACTLQQAVPVNSVSVPSIIEATLLIHNISAAEASGLQAIRSAHSQQACGDCD